MYKRIPSVEEQKTSPLMSAMEVAKYFNIDINLAMYIGEKCGAKVGNQFSLYYVREIIETDGFILVRKITKAIKE